MALVSLVNCVKDALQLISDSEDRNIDPIHIANIQINKRDFNIPPQLRENHAMSISGQSPS